MKIIQKLQARRDKVLEWEGESQKRKNLSYLLVFTLAFTICFTIALISYPLNGRSLVWSVDGLEQYYPFFIYEGEWLREIFHNLISGNGLVIPSWTHELGYGSDIPSVLDTFNDPLNLLSGICPPQFSEYLFQFLIVFRLYLAGLAFSLFASRFIKSRYCILLGAIAYTLCGTALTVTTWPASAWPMILFPLVIYCVERLLHNKSVIPFIGVMALSFIITYYSSYAMCIFLVPYCAFRAIQTRNAYNFKSFALWTLKILSLIVVAILISAFALLPSAMGILGIDRFSEVHATVPILYTFEYYLRLASSFISVTDIGSDCRLGLGALSFLSTVLLFMEKRKNTCLKLASIATLVILMLPALGSMLNGFNYATNRWAWAASLLSCFIFVKMIPTLMNLGARQKKVLVTASAIYAIIIFAFEYTRTESDIAGLMAIAICLGLLLTKAPNHFTKQCYLSAALVVSVSVSSFYYTASAEGGVATSAYPLFSMYDRLTTHSPNWAIANIEDDSIFRYGADPTSVQRTRNDSLVLGLKGTDFYNSSYNNNIDKYHSELGVCAEGINFSYKDLASRTILDTLAGVKYYMVPKASNQSTAYNFNNPDNIVSTYENYKNSYNVYQGENILPLAYTYSSYIPTQDYQAKTPIQKQESLLQGVVLDDSTLPKTKVKHLSQNIDFEVIGANGAVFEEGKIKATRPNSTITLQVDGLTNSETYLYFNNLKYESASDIELMDKVEFENQPWYVQIYKKMKNLKPKYVHQYTISATNNLNLTPKLITNQTVNNHMYGGKNDWLMDMGFTPDGVQTINITFSETGYYSYDDMQVQCQPMDNFDSSVSALKETPVEDLEFSTNKITATVKNTEACALYLSVPYSTGWSATVNGVPAEIKKANTAFMAIELPEGDAGDKLNSGAENVAGDKLDSGTENVAGHKVIELKYQSPGLKIGYACTVAGLVIAGIVYLFERTRMRKNKTT